MVPDFCEQFDLFETASFKHGVIDDKGIYALIRCQVVDTLVDDPG